MTTISVTIRLKGHAEVRGKEQYLTIFGVSLTVCVIAAMTRFASALLVPPPMRVWDWYAPPILIIQTYVFLG
jgi:hypothetical protein